MHASCVKLLGLFLLCAVSIGHALQQSSAPCAAHEQQDRTASENRRIKIASLKFESDTRLPRIADHLAKDILEREKDIEEGEGWDAQVTGAIIQAWENQGYARIQVDDL